MSYSAFKPNIVRRRRHRLRSAQSFPQWSEGQLNRGGRHHWHVNLLLHATRGHLDKLVYVKNRVDGSFRTCGPATYVVATGEKSDSVFRITWQRHGPTFTSILTGRKTDLKSKQTNCCSGSFLCTDQMSFKSNDSCSYLILERFSGHIKKYICQLSMDTERNGRKRYSHNCLNWTMTFHLKLVFGGLEFSTLNSLQNSGRWVS